MSLKKAIVVAVVLGLAGCGGKAEGQAGSPAKGAASPRACVEGLVGCVNRDDLVGASVYFTEPTRGRLAKIASAMAAVTTAQEKLVAAMDAKFGKGTGEKFGISVKHISDGATKVEIVDVKETGDTATVTTKEHDTKDTLPLVRQGGTWFVSPPKDHPEFGEDTFKDVDEQYPKIMEQAKAIEGIAADLAAGKLDLDKIEACYREALSGTRQN